MRLGLVGSGPQALRYLEPKNGGDHVIERIGGRPSAGDYAAFLSKVDGVVVASHPASHRQLCLAAIGAGKPVLCEKPLALNLTDCEDIIGAAAEYNVLLQVAHTHLWRQDAQAMDDPDPTVLIRYLKHERDYSAWLDWAPHGLALLAKAMPNWDTQRLVLSVSLAQSDERMLRFRGFDYLRKPHRFPAPTPMWLMLRDFQLGRAPNVGFLIRVYRALFAKEQHAQR